VVCSLSLLPVLDVLACSEDIGALNTSIMTPLTIHQALSALLDVFEDAATSVRSNGSMALDQTLM